jgi:hypothetical protein
LWGYVDADREQRKHLPQSFVISRPVREVNLALALSLLLYPRSSILASPVASYALLHLKSIAPL